MSGLCYSLAEDLNEFDDAGRSDLMFLCSFVQHNVPHFTAAGFFPISRSTLLSLVGVTVTYVIVALQLR